MVLIDDIVMVVCVSIFSISKSASLAGIVLNVYINSWCRIEGPFLYFRRGITGYNVST